LKLKKKVEVEEKKVEQKVEEKKFQQELDLLKSMGFVNETLNLHLLTKFNGKVEKVVEILLKF